MWSSNPNVRRFKIMTKKGQGAGEISWKGSSIGSVSRISCCEWAIVTASWLMYSSSSLGSREQEFSFSVELLCARPCGSCFIPSVMFYITATLLEGPSFCQAKWQHFANKHSLHLFNIYHVFPTPDGNFRKCLRLNLLIWHFQNLLDNWTHLYWSIIILLVGPESEIIEA